MDGTLITDPMTVALLGKIVGGVIVFFLAIGFIPGVIVGWFVGRVAG